MTGPGFLSAEDPRRSVTLEGVRVEPAHAVGTAVGWGGICATDVPDWVWTLRDGKPLARGATPTEVPAVELAGDWVWGGPTVHQPGHFVAEHATRLLLSARERPESRVLFGLRKNARVEDLAGWFWDVLDWLGIERERVGFVDQVPVVVERLTVFPQAEHLTDRLDDRPALREKDASGLPSAVYLAALAENYAGKGLEPWENEHVYVSRAGMPVRLGGERFLEQALEAAGVLVVRPEALSVTEQMRLFAGAKHLIVSEGSALHFRQLLGYVPQQITVFSRRPGRMVARGPLLSRADSLRYVDVARGLVVGPFNRETGAPIPSVAFPLTDHASLVAAVSELGIDPEPLGDVAGFRASLEEDLLEWGRHMGRLGRGESLRYALNAVVSMAALRQDAEVGERLALEIAPHRSIASVKDVTPVDAERQALASQVESLRRQLESVERSASLRVGRSILAPAIRAKRWYDRTRRHP